MQKIRKIGQEEVEKAQKRIGKLSPTEKDKLLAALLLTNERMAEILKSIISSDEDRSQKEKGEIKNEIEQAISIGPSWLNYSYKLKKKKHQ